MSLFETVDGPDPASFAGDDYDPALDDARLSGQIRRIYEVMKDGHWRTIDNIHVLTGDPQASILAQLGHLRKERFGSYLVEKRSVGERERGLYEYRVGGKGEGTPRQRALITPAQELALRAADELIQYGQHKVNCRANSGVIGVKCSCGLDAARHAYREARQETRGAQQ